MNEWLEKIFFGRRCELCKVSLQQALSYYQCTNPDCQMAYKPLLKKKFKFEIFIFEEEKK